MANYLTILARSIRTGGFTHTLRSARRYFAVLLSKAADSDFDRQNGLDTGRIVETGDMIDVQSPHLHHGIRYEPSRARPFVKLVRSLDLPRDKVFVDIGCGMGRVLLLAAGEGFRRLVGVEYSPALCEIARRNIASRNDIDVQINVVESDAAHYEFLPDQCVIYLFNPFDDTVMNHVLDRIGESMSRSPRTMWLIYQYPSHREVIESRNLFSPVKHVWHGGCEFVVYKTSFS